MRHEMGIHLAMGAAGVALLTLDIRQIVVTTVSAAVPSWLLVLLCIAAGLIGSWWVLSCIRYLTSTMDAYDRRIARMRNRRDRR